MQNIWISSVYSVLEPWKELSKNNLFEMIISRQLTIFIFHMLIFCLILSLDSINKQDIVKTYNLH